MTAVAWLGPAPDGPVVALVVQAAYHLDELVPLRDELRVRGVAAELLVVPPPRKPLHRFRPSVRRFSEMLAATGRRERDLVAEPDLLGRTRALVVLNDWGVPRPLVLEAKAAGRPTFGWIEGVQDFADADTPYQRAAYRTVDHVFSLGDYSREQLADRPGTVIGSERLRRIWAGPEAEPSGVQVTINSNFTYGVLSDARTAWLRSVRQSCRAAGVSPVLSRHSAERGVVVRPRPSLRPISELLHRSTHLVTRLSTVAYEALARGVEVAYHNPHGEQVETFRDPAGAFATTTDTDELTAWLRRPVRTPAEIRADARAFLGHHVRLDDGPPPAALAADVIAAAL